MKIVAIVCCVLSSMFAVTFSSPETQEDLVNVNDYYRWPNDYNTWTSQLTSDELGQLYMRPIIKVPFLELLRNNRLKKTNVAPPPPGFVGARGRRGNSAVLNELNDYLASNLGGDDQLNVWVKQQRPSTNKKADLAMYKDGFIGARG